MTDGPHKASQNPHGTIGEEAVKLAEAVQGWLGQRTGQGPSDVWAAATAPDAFESPECRVCPICRAMHFLTTMQPEVFVHLADAATSLAAAARALGEAESRSGHPRPPDRPSSGSPHPPDAAGEQSGER